MSKYNIDKARKKLKAAEDEELRNEILSHSPSKTTVEILQELYNETGWTKTHFSRYIGYAYNTIKRWCDNNENTVLVDCVCRDIKRRYWHKRNADRYCYELD